MSEFTLVDDRVPNHDLLLMKAMRASSIPVIISESIVLPFSEIIDWKRYVFFFLRKWVKKGSSAFSKISLF